MLELAESDKVLRPLVERVLEMAAEAVTKEVTSEREVGVERVEVVRTLLLLVLEVVGGVEVEVEVETMVVVDRVVLDSVVLSSVEVVVVEVSSCSVSLLIVVVLVLVSGGGVLVLVALLAVDRVDLLVAAIAKGGFSAQLLLRRRMGPTAGLGGRFLHSGVCHSDARRLHRRGHSWPRSLPLDLHLELGHCCCMLAHPPSSRRRVHVCLTVRVLYILLPLVLMPFYRGFCPLLPVVQTTRPARGWRIRDRRGLENERVSSIVLLSVLLLRLRARESFELEQSKEQSGARFPSSRKRRDVHRGESVIGNLSGTQHDPPKETRQKWAAEGSSESTVTGSTIRLDRYRWCARTGSARRT